MIFNGRIKDSEWRIQGETNRPAAPGQGARRICPERGEGGVSLKSRLQTLFHSPLAVAHLALLAAGTAFLVSGAFHSALWFDESYTVGLMNHDFLSMCSIASYDVHPFLYYILLKLITLVFGGGIVVMRLFSVAGGVALAVLGFSHIRRDFNAKVGFWFTFFAFAMPVMFKYAWQIRMYTWAPFFVTLAALYAYRIAYGGEDHWKKNWILFTLFSLASAYTHYFGLFSVIVINLFLLAYVVKNRRWVLRWLVFGLIQITAYLPGAWVLLRQMKEGGAVWIEVKYPQVLENTLDFYFIGGYTENATDMSQGDFLSATIVAGAVWIFFLMMLILRLHKDPKDAKPAVLAWLVDLGILAVTLLVSLFREIYFVRYTMVLYGLIVFFFAYLMSGVRRKGVQIAVAAVFLAVTVRWVVPAYQSNYDVSATAVEDTLGGVMQDGDVMLLNDRVGAFITVKFPELDLYYYNPYDDNEDNAFQALAYQVHIVHDTRQVEEDLRDYTGNIWVFQQDSVFCDLVEQMPDVQKVEILNISTKYYFYSYDLVLYQKG